MFHALMLLACSAPTPAPGVEPIPPPAPVEPEAPQPLPVPVVKAQSSVQPGKRRLVAIGDLHGDRVATLEVLQLAGLTDVDGNWTGGDTVFVQTGDLTDRGPDSKGVIDLMRKLQKDAKKAGGTVHLLNGNHEIMNLRGDWRYVSEGDLAGFGGRMERLSAFSPSGEYGAFLSNLPVVVKVDNTVFVHGGLHPEFAEQGIEAINAAAKAHYFDPMEQRHPINDELGPTWFRGYVRAPETEACPVLDRALKALGATRMVVGHTTSKGEMQTRCGGALTVVDVGISTHYGHNLGAWESIDGDARSLLPTGPADLPDP